MRNTLTILLLVILLFAGVFFIWPLTGSSRTALSHRAIATQVLAEHIQAHAKPKAVLVASNPYTQRKGSSDQINDFEDAGIDGLREGLADRTELVIDYPQLRPEVQANPSAANVDPNSRTPLSFHVAPGSFDQLVTKHPKCSVLVTLIGLPVDLRQLQSWKTSGPPSYALLLPDWRMIGSAQEIAMAFESGKLIAAVVDKPGGTTDATPPSSDYQKEFENRFILVTKENFAATASAYPGLFQ